jgi:hypothetical protein
LSESKKQNGKLLFSDNSDRKGEKDMKRILILNTGGTFSSQASENGLAPSITGDEILKKLGIVKQSTINTTLIGTFDMYELKVTGLQGWLIAKVSQALGILNLSHTNSSTTNLGQLIGAHVGQHASHIMKLALIFLSIPLKCAFRHELIIVLTLIVSGIKKILKIIKTYAIYLLLLFILGLASHQNKE